MAVSAFKSTTRRGTVAGPPGAAASARDPPSEDPGRRAPSRRSRSVSAAPRSRSRLDAPAAAMPEFPNKRDNPLFCISGVSPADSGKSMQVGEKEGSDEESDRRRGRSASRGAGLQRKEWGRSLSTVDTGRRRRSVSRGHCGNSESEVEVSTMGNRMLGDYSLDGRRKTNAMGESLSKQTRNLRTSSTPQPFGEHLEPNMQVSAWDDGISTSSFSEVEEKTIKAVSEQMKSFQNEHPLSDSSSGIYETVRSEVRRAMSEIRSDLENVIHRRDISVTSMSNGVDTPSELVRPDSIELLTDIGREYALKLQQTQERARKLRADLDLEEQHSQDLSRILKETLPDQNSPEMQRSRPRRKTSIERHKMSRRLTEEAMTYFDECVSISTFDTSDFSSPEDQPAISFDDKLPSGNSNFSENKDPHSSAVCFPSDPINHSEFGSPFSISKKSLSPVGVHDIKHYIRKFGKEFQEGNEHLNVRSSYNRDDYDLNVSHERFLFERIILRNRIESGCLLICDVRTF